MATTTWDAFYDKVLPRVKGCSLPMALNAIAEAAIEFCEETFVWKFDHPAIDAVATQGTYAFVPAANTKICRIDRAWYNGTEIYPKTADELNSLYKQWSTETGTPLYYLQEQLESVRLVPIPTVALVGALVMKTSIMPSSAATGFDTQLYERYLDDIAAGALEILMVMPDKPWTNAQAAYYAGKFEEAKDKARYKATKGHTRARIRHTSRGSRFL